MKLYKSPLKVPEGKIGKWKVVHKTVPAGEEIIVVSMRTTLMSGLQPANVQYDRPQTYHHLTYNGGTVMSDIPQEQYGHTYVVKKLKGRVLIGGLGLGYVTTLLNKKKTVTDIVVVEKEKAVIDLVWPHINADKAGVVQEDIFKFLKNPLHKHYDYIYLDIWTGDSESVFYETVLPLRKLARPLVNDSSRIVCWKEDTMRGQIKTNLEMNVRFPDMFNRIKELPEEDFVRMFGDKWGQVSGPFWNWVRTMNVRPEVADAVITKYVDSYGEAEWELVWGKWKLC